jgi:hypothetical protein
MHGFEGMTHEVKPGRRTVVPVEALKAVERPRKIRALRQGATASEATAKRSGRNHGAKKESLRLEVHV